LMKNYGDDVTIVVYIKNWSISVQLN
jgi:hypothetical protein